MKLFKNLTDADMGNILIELVLRRPIGRGIAMWDINTALPIAPTIEKSLAILAQDWDGDIVSFYRTDHDKKNMRTLVETTGKPVRLEDLNGVFFVLHTDHDDRFRWRVTEISSGCAMSKPKASEKDALDALTRVKKQYGAEGIIRIIEDSRKAMQREFAANGGIPETLGAMTERQA